MKKTILFFLMLFITCTISAQKGTIKVKKVEPKTIQTDCNFEFKYEKELLGKNVTLKRVCLYGMPEYDSEIVTDSVLALGVKYKITKLDFQQYLTDYCAIRNYKIKSILISDAAGFYDNRGELFSLLIFYEKLW